MNKRLWPKFAENATEMGVLSQSNVLILNKHKLLSNLFRFAVKKPKTYGNGGFLPLIYYHNFFMERKLPLD